MPGRPGGLQRPRTRPGRWLHGCRREGRRRGREAIFKVIQRRLDRTLRQRPAGFLVRSAPAEDVARLKELTGKLRAGRFLTRFRKVFTREEIDDDLILVPGRVGSVEDVSEYTEIFPPRRPDIQPGLAAHRRSLSPQRFSEGSLNGRE